MADSGLEKTLANLPSHGTIVKDRGYRQVWRFEHEGRACYLKFYPRHGPRDSFRRFFRGSPALREFVRLQWLQKAGVPAPRAVAVLMGFKINRADGDAVILEAIEPATPLDQILNQADFNAEPVADHLEIASQLRTIVQKLAQARLGHSDLHPGNVLVKKGKLYLLDAYAVHRGGLALKDLLKLGHSVGRFATRTDLLRGWRQLGPGGPLPLRNQVTEKLVSDSLQRVTRENRYFGRLRSGEWSGSFFKLEKHPRRWSAASRLTATAAQWQAAWPQLWRQIEADELQVIKRSPSGDVLAGELQLGAERLPIIVKRPRRRYWYRYLNEIGRGSRAHRAWLKSWNLIFRNLPTAWPLLVLQRRRHGYVTDGVIVFERVPGPTLNRVDLDALTPDARDKLFRRSGRILREIERQGFSHFDAKASNWIVRDDEKLGPGPILVDSDGIRHRRWPALGIRRLLRSLREREQYAPDDSLSLCQGYAPFAPLQTGLETAESLHTQP